MEEKSLIEENEIFPLTGLRFIAAFYVFLFHMQIRWPIAHHRFMKNILEQGAVGMSLFFMLSGFVLAYRYGNGRLNVKDYLVNRFARIYPIYALAAFTGLPLFGVDFGSWSFQDIGLGVGRSVMLVFTNALLIQAWFPQLFTYWNDAGSWSISVEAFCYILLPFLLPAFLRLSYKNTLRVAGLCFFMGVLPGISAKFFNFPVINVFYSLPIYRLPEFLIGVCVCLAVRSGKAREFGVRAQAVVLLAFIVYLGVGGSAMPMYIGHDWIVLPVTAFMLFSLSRGKGFFAFILSSRIFVWFGRISYSFYSFQVIVVLFLIIHHDALVHYIPILSNNLVLAATTFLALVMVSSAGYYLVESPARRWIRRCYHSVSVKGGAVNENGVCEEGAANSCAQEIS